MPASLPIRAVAYYRKSNEDDGSSIDQQRDWAQPACRKEGIELVREFADQSKKGHETASRTAFHEMLKFCQEQARKRTPIDAIICWHHNRLSRADSQETAWFVWEFRKAGVNRMLTANRWYDFRRMEDRVLLNIEQDTSNHKYSLDLAQASTRGRIAAARDGRWCGGVIPVGYRAEREEVLAKGQRRMRPKRFILGPESEVETVRLVFRLYADTGMGFRAIAQELTRRGIPTPTNRPAWASGTVKRILINPAYLGHISWNKVSTGKFIAVVECKPVERPDDPGKIRGNDKDQWVESADRHEAIIDLLTWERCQQKLAGRRGGKRRTRGTFVLTGLLRCAHCGYAMTGCTGYKGRRLYRCCGQSSHGGDSCHYNAVDADALTDALLRKLRAAWSQNVNLDAIMAEVERQEATGEIAGGHKAESLRRRLRQLDADLAEGMARLRTIDLSLIQGYQEGLKVVQAERDEKAAELNRLETEPTPAAERRRRVEEAMTVLRRLNLASAEGEPDLLRELLAEAVAKIEVWFHHEPFGKTKTRCKFARALVWVREDVALLCTKVRDAD